MSNKTTANNAAGRAEKKASSETVLIQVDRIMKRFPGVLALNNVHLDLRVGEVLGLIGENGAGKSTLMNILLGSFPPDEGEMQFKGKPYKPHSPSDALKTGISMIHQEISLVHSMSVAENIWIGRENKFSQFGVMSVKKRLKATKDLLSRCGIDLDPEAKVSELSIANMQLVEVARAVSYDSDVIIMDEPTSALTNSEIDKLYAIIRDLSSKGKGIIFISHKLDELFDVCNRVTVMRDGQYVTTRSIDDISQDELVTLMVGREIKDMYPKETVNLGDVALEVKNLTRKGSFKDISFQVHRGEILGFCGLMGAQRTEIMQAIFGIDRPSSGEILLDGTPIRNRSTDQAINNKIAMVTEDRLRRGAIHKLSVKVNMSLAYLKTICKVGFVDRKKENEDCLDMVEKMSIKVSSLDQTIGSLSGGNQQKVIIGKWLLTEPEVLILDEPTRGIDVGSKAEIYKLIGELAKQQKAIIMISSDLPEVMGISDRILVVREGQIVAEKQRGEFSQDVLMKHAFGV